mgnify:CR=1 FL=1
MQQQIGIKTIFKKGGKGLFALGLGFLTIIFSPFLFALMIFILDNMYLLGSLIILAFLFSPLPLSIMLFRYRKQNQKLKEEIEKLKMNEEEK